MMDQYWYRDKKLLRAAREEYGSLSAAACAVGGVHRTTLSVWWNKLGMEKLPKGPEPMKTQNNEALQAIYRRVYGD